MKSLQFAAILVSLCGATALAADQPPSEKQPKELSLDCGNGQALKLIMLPAGEFLMGSPEKLPGLAVSSRSFQYGDNNPQPVSPEEQPQHKVRITKPFYMGVFTVTQAQYEALMGANPSRYKGANRPVEMVSWNDAVAFCKKLSAKTGRQVRLPTEAEWEYACRAGTTSPWYTGETLTNKQANFRDYWGWTESIVYHSTTPVGSYPPNPWGLYDMHGNVQQWCQDWYTGGYYKLSPGDDPTGPVEGEGSIPLHIARGGGWDAVAGECRSARRFDSVEPETARDWTKGFRVVCVCTPEELKSAPQAKELEAFVSTQVAARLLSNPSPAPAGSSPPAGPGSGPATKVPETLAQRFDGTFYYRPNPIPAKVPERFTSEKRKVTVATPNGQVEKEITYYKNSLGMEMVLIPAGEFMMGTGEDFYTGCAAYTSWHQSPDKFEVFPSEKPQHKVRITKPFFMGSTEVTYEQYVAVMGPHKTCWRYQFGKKLLDGFDYTRPPVSDLTWYDAAEFCKRLSEMIGRQVRLPTEAEWEYACRAGTTTFFYTGEKISYKQGSFWPDWKDVDGTFEVPHDKVHYQQVSVGSYPPNPWGLYDMHGSLWELCQDWYDPNYYKVSPVDDPTGPTGPVPDTDGNKKKVARGGSWDGFPAETRSAMRMESREPQFQEQNVGFRVVIVCTPQEIKEAANAAGAVPNGR